MVDDCLLESMPPVDRERAVAGDLKARARRQIQLFEEAQEHPDRVLPDMFIADSAYCESKAVYRRDNGYYNYFYTTQPSISEATIDDEELPPQLRSVSGSQLEIRELVQELRYNGTVSEEWDLVANGGRVLCRLPVFQYFQDEDCYIHADPWPGYVCIDRGVASFVYTRQSDKPIDTVQPWNLVQGWLCGRLLEAAGFVDTESDLPLGLLKHTEAAEQRSILEVEQRCLEKLLPEAATEDVSVSTPQPTRMHDSVAFHQTTYIQDSFNSDLASWLRLFFGKRDPTPCGRKGCSYCE